MIIIIIWKKKPTKQILNLATKSLTVSRKFKKILNLSGHKDRQQTITRDLEAELTFRQTEGNNCTLGGINLTKNEPFVKILSCKDTLHITVGIA